MTIAVLVLLTIFSFVGTIGNSLVLYIYATKKEKSTAGIFIMSLAGTDLFTCFVIIPYTEAAIALEYKLVYDAVCKVYMFLITCNIPFSAFVMVAIAVDRYFCICHPFLHAINLRRAKAIVLSLLVLASIFGVLTSLSHGVYIYQPKQIGNNSGILEYTENGNITAPGIPFYDQNRTYNGNQNMSIQNNTMAKHDTIDITGTNEMEIIYIEVCSNNNIILGPDFSAKYQKVYAGFYLVSFIAVVILYGLIYKSIQRHRAKKSKRKRSSLYPTGVSITLLLHICDVI